MIIGAHVSAAGGAINAISRAKELGITAIQIFASPPRNWNPPKITSEDALNFKKAAIENNISHIFLHAIYLTNIASLNPFIITKSKKSLIEYLNVSSLIGSNGVVFHSGYGSGKTFDEVKDNVIDNINEILENSDLKSTLIIETNAGQKNAIGASFEQIKELINGIKSPKRIGVCLDTAHTFASGYDWVNKGAKEIINEFDQKIGLEYLKAIHCNDSKSDFNSHVDRHENIGQGKIGDKVFKELLHLESIKNIPFILETPGFANTGPDQKNIDHLKELAK